MTAAIELIESLPADFEGYSANEKSVNEAIDDFNREMYLKWSK